MKRRSAAAVLIVGLLLLAGCRMAAGGKDAILALATGAIVLTLDSTSGAEEVCEEADSTPEHATAQCHATRERAIRG